VPRGSDPTGYIFTSGTTGLPKGVRVGQASLLNYVGWLQSTGWFDAATRSILLNPPWFDLGYTVLFGALLLGGSVALPSEADRRDPGRAIRAIVRTAVNEPPEAVGTLPLICLRVIPDPEGGRKPSLAQLVSVLFSAKPLIGSDGKAEVYSGPGHMDFGCPSDARLPIVQLLSFKYAHFNADLPYGKILKTFSPEEF